MRARRGTLGNTVFDEVKNCMHFFARKTAYPRCVMGRLYYVKAESFYEITKALDVPQMNYVLRKRTFVGHCCDLARPAWNA
jgi:hypothetical protein